MKVFCNKITESLIKYIFEKIVLAISYCHDSGYIHGDIKPDNILLGIELNGSVNDVKLADFGMV